MRKESLNQTEIVVCACRVLLFVVLLGAASLSFRNSAANAQTADSAISAASPVNSVSETDNHLLEASAIPTPTPAPRERQQRAPLDFNGDNKTDFVAVRSADANSPSFWYIHNGNDVDAKKGQQWGNRVGSLQFYRGVNNSDGFAVPADYDGDGKTGFAVWRRGAQAYFYILQSSSNTFRAEAFGQTGNDPSVVGDYDGDGRTDITLYNRSSGRWSILPTTGAPPFYFYWGQGAANGQSRDTPPAIYVVRHPGRFVS